ncbi:AraC family transcriptional regulator [Tenacibaculum sp. M341]|uniref:AraC family transcriptional regulator n=1 Tax=Tenacibaculum sp. M341 TaxID=2530339 RepID=UPI00104ACE0D|nr:AraC family transcriptional regulator [Tenacibaculum sp. M341]TCI84625.1 AraC family transcriptional regulator [Tenacibaculum sp. M341]
MPRTIIENIVIKHYENETYFDFCRYTSIRFFEILYFEKGTGNLKINGKTVPYTDNTVFVFIPDDIYTVNVDSATTVTTIKFLKSFFNNPVNTTTTLPINKWFRNIEGILYNEIRQLRLLEFEEKFEKDNLTSLIKLLTKEYLKDVAYDAFVVENSLSMSLHLIARNMRVKATNLVTKKTSSKIQDIINYIQVNIYNPQTLSTKNLAEEFNIADNYISQYFKKSMGMSIKKYILNYKLKLVETRLKYTDMQFAEIALELGFTDASHLNKTFLAYKGITIGAFKESLK